MDAFLKSYNLPRFNHEEIENLTRPITSKETETVIKKLPTKGGKGIQWSKGSLFDKWC